MTRQGNEQAAANVEMMSGLETEAEVTRISFAPIEDVPKQIGTGTYVGTVVEFTGVPSGYLLVLFDEESAEGIAEALMPMAPDGEGRDAGCEVAALQSSEMGRPLYERLGFETVVRYHQYEPER